MSYRPRYTINLVANPTTPGVTTVAAQTFDGSLLTDRYIKQLTNALRKYGVLPRHGGMYGTAVMAAAQLGCQEPVGFTMGKYWGPCISGQDRRTPVFDKKLFKSFETLCKVRVETKRALGGASVSDPWSNGVIAYYDKHWERDPEWYDGVFYASGWEPGERTPFREAFREHVIDKVPGYMADMERIAAFLETRPKFTLMDGKALVVVNDAKDKKNAILK